MSSVRIPKVTAKCYCNSVVLEISEIDPGFTACHCGKCGTRLHYKFEDELWKSHQNRYVVSAGLLYKSGIKNLKMLNEVSYEVKPHYYCFEGNRPKLSTSEAYALFALESQKP